MKATNVDELLLKFGDPGKYQVAVYLMLWISICATSFNNFMVLFVVSDYPHNCKLPDEWKWSVNESIPLKENGELEECLMYKNPINRSEGTTSCLFGYQHHTPGKQWSIVQEWDLVCSNRHLGAMSNSLYYCGVMVGCLIFGYLSDKVGRKPVIISCLYLHIVIAIAVSYSASFTMYVGLRMVHGALLQGIVGTAVIMSVEIVQPHRRNIVAIGNQVLWPTMLFTVTAFSYVVGHWRTMHLIGGVPAIVTVAYIWLLPESVRWLLVFRKLPEAHYNLLKIARFNKQTVPEDLKDQIKTVADNIEAAKTSTTKNSEIRELFKTSKIRQILFSGCYVWFATTLTSWGIAYSMPKIGASSHINFFIASSAEIVLNICVMYKIMQRFGRRNVCISIMTISSSLNVLAAIFRLSLPEHESWATIILGLTSVAGRISLSMFFACMPTFFRELYPTNVRTMANGVTQMAGRPASIIAPYVLLLEKEVWKPLPFLIYSIFCVGNILIAYALPETLNKPLPEIPEDIEKLWISKSARTKWRYSLVKNKKKTDIQNNETTASE